jgi:hypothetical protein
MTLAAIAISPLALISPAYLAALGARWLLGPIAAVITFWVLYVPLQIQLLGAIRKRTGLWNGVARAAMHEEQAYREGAEEWAPRERVKACVIFALLHLWNWFYPLALLAPLATGGAWLMGMYLRSYRRNGKRIVALTQAALYHYAYNRLAIGTFAAIVVGFSTAHLLQ